MSLSHSAKCSQTPSYCWQREKIRPDRACVWINGKKITLGAYDSPESMRRYHELTGQNLPAKSKPVPTTEPTVAVVMARYLQHA
jgi:hypothetical protein